MRIGSGNQQGWVRRKREVRGIVRGLGFRHGRIFQKSQSRNPNWRKIPLTSRSLATQLCCFPPPILTHQHSNDLDMITRPIRTLIFCLFRCHFSADLNMISRPIWMLIHYLFQHRSSAFSDAIYRWLGHSFLCWFSAYSDAISLLIWMWF
jgi:hypothetical protein